MATSSKEKVQLLVSLFAWKMKVDNPGESPPHLELQCKETITKMEATQVLVERLLRGLDTQKATGPYNLSPQMLKHCPSYHCLYCLPPGKYLYISVERSSYGFRSQAELQV